MSFDNIPDDLQQLPQWLVWKTELRRNKSTGDTKPTKVPYQARKRGFVKASSTDADTWTSFEFARKRVESDPGMDGIGFVFSKSDPYIGFDIDGLSSGEDRFNMGHLVDEMATYAEISPSGDGIHLIGMGTTPDQTGKHPQGLGIFPHSRFFTMTGDVLDGIVRPIASVQAIIDREWDTWFPKGQENAPIPVRDTPFFPSDQDVVDKLRSAANAAHFETLWSGNTANHGGDHSAADLALASLIAFYTQDRDQIARIIGHSALGRRDKWQERADYREMTITKALQRSEFYTPPSNSDSGLTIIRGTSSDGTPSQVFTFNTTDKGNALRVLHHYGDTIRYCHQLKTWLVWDGQKWVSDDSDEITRICMATAETIYDEASSVPSDEMGKILRKHAIATEAERRLAAMGKLASAFQEVSVSLSALDANPFLLNVENGTIDLSTGRFRPHSRSDYLTKIAPVVWDPHARCPTWERFLHTVFAGNTDLVSFVQRALGYAMTGDVTERAMFILYGSGRNGKSTLVETIARILGDYATTSSADLVSARKGDPTMPTDLARLLGIRFTMASETGESSRLDEARVKHITGGDTIIGEQKYKDPFSFVPQFKIWLSTNHQPMIRGVDDGIWDRIRLIPFEVRIPDSDVDRYLKDKLLREASGILNWLVQGCLAWQRDGLMVNDSVADATREYRQSMDSLGFFIEECCAKDNLSGVPISDLYTAYERWSKEAGEYTLSKRALTNRLRDRGFQVEKQGIRHTTTVLGLRLVFSSEISSGNVIPYRNIG